jgi:AcrR family transcriptional regulator
MTQRSPSVIRILNAAIAHFSHRGYDASSLTEIAEAAGMRKASLYSHFANKDSLFMDAFNDALQSERAIAAACFKEETADEQPGSRYSHSMVTRYTDSAQLRFLLRASYIPPESLETQLTTAYEIYLVELSSAFKQNLARHADSQSLSAEDIATFSEVYLGIVDSLQVKLAYTTPEQAMIRLTAMQRLFSNTLQHA